MTTSKDSSPELPEPEPDDEVGAGTDSGDGADAGESATPSRRRRRRRQDRRRVSPLRCLTAMGMLATVCFGGTQLVRWVLPASAANAKQYFAPYVDVTLTPQLDFQDPIVNPNPYVTLAFVVSGKVDACQPAWGGAYGLDEAASQLDLDRRIARLRQRGGDVMVSFGGAANSELATSCSDPDKLLSAYQSVIDRYQVSAIDLDIEGASLDDTAAVTRRATAMAELQKRATDAGHHLDVWLTLPVAPNGLQANGIAVVDAMLSAKVDLTGVNIMTMDYGGSRDPNTDMVTASLNAVDATAQQVATSYGKVGTTLTPAQTYDKVGATPMIGQNDFPADRFTTGDAERFAAGTRSRGLRRLSMWSLNRDSKCGGNIDGSIADNNCSGVDQTPLQFSAIFRDSASTTPATEANAAAAAAVATATAPSDTEAPIGRAPAPEGPGSGPYAAWRPRREYEKDTKVVWNGIVYQAKWWNVGTQPDAPVKNEWDSPWRVLGPVLAEDLASAVVPATLPPGTYPDWNLDKIYYSGDRVMFDGLGYKAKWWTRGDNPATDVDNSWESPWEPVGAPDDGSSPSTTTTTTPPPADASPAPSDAPG